MHIFYQGGVLHIDIGIAHTYPMDLKRTQLTDPCGINFSADVVFGWFGPFLESINFA